MSQKEQSFKVISNGKEQEIKIIPTSDDTSESFAHILSIKQTVDKILEKLDNSNVTKVNAVNNIAKVNAVNSNITKVNAVNNIAKVNAVNNIAKVNAVNNVANSNVSNSNVSKFNGNLAQVNENKKSIPNSKLQVEPMDGGYKKSKKNKRKRNLRRSYKKQ